MAFQTTRAIVDGIAYRNPVYGDVRDFGDFAELLEVLWWLSDNDANAGQQMIARGRANADPDGTPITLRYRRLCPLFHLKREDTQDAADDIASPYLDRFDRSMDAGPPPPESPFVYSGARLMIDGTYLRPLNKSAEEIVISRIARPPAGSPAVGNAADMLRGHAVYDSQPASDSPFDQPNGKIILYAVIYGTGRWRNATNVIVRYGPSGITVPPREVIIVRGARPYHHANPTSYSTPPAAPPAPPTM
jgi:hypothetical protein